MPAYEEILPRKLRSIFFLAIAFLFIYSPFQLSNWQFRRREERYAAIAYEINIYQPNTIIHGEQIPLHYPLYPWLVALLHKTGLSFEFCLRIISVASLGILSILAWEAGRRAANLQAAVVAGAVMFSSIIIIEKTLDGYPHLTGLLFLTTAWLSWFTFGVARGQWNRAWITAFFFCGLGFYTLGWQAVLYFIFPLVFMRRPMTVWQKLNKPGFGIGLLVLLSFVLVWGIPRWYTGYDIPFQSLQIFPITVKEYVHHLIFFPFDIIFRFMPWTLIAWPAFCVAYFPLDKNPIFSRFLRTIVISLFFLFWFSPFTDARDIIFMAPAIAVLCGINYWLVVRRHGKEIHNIVKVLSIAAVLTGIGIIIFYTTAFPWSLDWDFIPKELSFRDSNRFIGITQALVVIALGFFALFKANKGLKVMTHILIISVAFALCFWSVTAPNLSMKTDKIEMGQAFAKAIRKDMQIAGNEPFPDNFTVYKGPGILWLHAACVYMNTKVIKIHKLEELPKDLDPVYMIGTEYPVSNDRSWEYITPKDVPAGQKNPYVYRDTMFYIFKGTIVKQTEKKPAKLPKN